MARDWVKLHVGILDDPRFGQLSPEAGWMWTRFLALAGRNEDSGRLGTVDQIAWVLHATPEAVSDAVSQLNGWISETDGQLYVRDWSEWQPASSTERWRKHAQTTTNADQREQTAPTPTNGTNADQRTRARADQTRRELEQTRTEETRTTPASRPAEPVASPDSVWDAFYDDAASFYMLAPRTKREGVRAWIGQMASMAGKVTNDDPELARDLLHAWHESSDFEFAKNPNLAPAKFGQWLALNGATLLAASEVVQR